MVKITAIVDDCVSSDEESSFELIDIEEDDGLSQSMKKLSLSVEEFQELEAAINEEVASKNAEMAEINLLRGIAALKEDEIDRLSQSNEEMKEEIEVFKWKDRMLEKLQEQKQQLQEAEERTVSNLIELRKGIAEDKIKELNGLHQAEIAEKNAEIDRLSRVNQQQRKTIEVVKKKILLKLGKFREQKDTVAMTTRNGKDEQTDKGVLVHNFVERFDEGGRRLRETEKDKAEKVTKALRKTEEMKSPSGVRTIRLRKIKGKFGAGHNGTMITAIEKGGPSDLAGLKIGHEIISMNGIDVGPLSNDEITTLSERVSDDVTLIVRYSPENLAVLEESK